MEKITKEYVKHLLENANYSENKSTYEYEFDKYYVKIYKHGNKYPLHSPPISYKVEERDNDILLIFFNREYIIKEVYPLQSTYTSNDVFRKITLMLDDKEIKLTQYKST